MAKAWAIFDADGRMMNGVSPYNERSAWRSVIHTPRSPATTEQIDEMKQSGYTCREVDLSMSDSSPRELVIEECAITAWNWLMDHNIELKRNPSMDDSFGICKAIRALAEKK